MAEVARDVRCDVDEAWGSSNKPATGRARRGRVRVRKRERRKGGSTICGGDCRLLLARLETERCLHIKKSGEDACLPSTRKLTSMRSHGRVTAVEASHNLSGTTAAPISALITHR